MTESAPAVEAPDAVLFNGVPAERLDALCLLTDRGLHYGDGLFETIACRRGRPRLLAEHFARLALGCERLRIGFLAFDALGAEIERLAAERDRAIVKVLVTRGPAIARGYGPRGDERPSRIVMRYGWPAEDPRRASDGVAVRIADYTLTENPRLAGLKHLNRLEQVIARAELRDAQEPEALLLSRSGCLVSGTMSNVFLARGGRLATPRLDRCGVAGVMRRVVMRTAMRAGIEVEEARLTRHDLEASEEVFLTNARIGIWPVRSLGARPLAGGPLTRRLQRLLEPVLDGTEPDGVEPVPADGTVCRPGSPEKGTP